jgi:hypothetical protein
MGELSTVTETVAAVVVLRVHRFEGSSDPGHRAIVQLLRDR